MYMKHLLFGSLCMGLMLSTVGCVSQQSSDIEMPRRATQTEIRKAGTNALQELYKTMPLAKSLAPKAKAILIFPKIYKAGFVVGGQSGDGVSLTPSGFPLGYYNISAASYGLQIGAQGFSYALFLMSDEAVEYVKKTAGWEIGVGPSVVLVDEGIAKTLTTTTAKADVYSFVFEQKGLMAGIGLQGSKITRITPEP
jgi:lipid-binding SYLF domain-containing protein